MSSELSGSHAPMPETEALIHTQFVIQSVPVAPNMSFLEVAGIRMVKELALACLCVNMLRFVWLRITTLNNLYLL